MGAGDGFEGKVAVVTGAASGIGKALAEALTAAGARVVLGDVNVAGLEAVSDALDCAAQPTDVRDPAQVESLVDRAVRTHGRIDIMINNAGVAVGGEIHHQDLEQWMWVVDVNLKGVIHGVHAAYDRMVAQGSGHIVNVASVAGLVPVPGLVPYATTKHAVVGLSESLRPEAAARGVAVTCVCPGFVQTPILDSPFASPGLDKDKLLKAAWPWPMMRPEALARRVLAGIARNDAYVVVPRPSRLVWRIYRLAPARVLARLTRAFARGRPTRDERAGSPGGDR